jgi:hypothetical protein
MKVWSRIFYDPIYKRAIRLIIAEDFADVATYYRKRNVEPADLEFLHQARSTSAAKTFNIGNKEWVILLRQFSGSAYHVSLLVHEILHVTIFVLRDLGMRLSDDSDEAYTYYAELLTKWALTVLQKRGTAPAVSTDTEA